MSLSDRIDALLPQTQCTRCGFPTCRAYAEAIAGDQAEINQCPPGGEDGVSALAHVLGRAPLLLNPANGLEEAPALAVVDENVCIGCTKCIQACPVDAIVGAAKRMHTVVAAECTGCGLCLPPCPVDCIALLPAADAALTRAQILARAAQARERFDARNARLAQTSAIARRRPGAASAPLPAPPPPSNLEREGFKSIAAAADPAVDSGSASPISRSAVLEAIARGKARRAAKGSPTR